MQVNDGSPAARAGVRPGDVITHFADQPVTGASQLQRAVERAPLGSRQKLRVIRRGREVELTVVTEALPDNATLGARTIEGQDQESSTSTELGLEVADLTPDLVERLNLPADTKGVVVVDVQPNGIARQSGVQRGTVIVEVNGTGVESVKDFEKAMEGAEIEKGVTLTVKVPGFGTRFLILKQR
jgi:serine protease Do